MIELLEIGTGNKKRVSLDLLMKTPHPSSAFIVKTPIANLARVSEYIQESVTPVGIALSELREPVDVVSQNDSRCVFGYVADSREEVGDNKLNTDGNIWRSAENADANCWEALVEREWDAVALMLNGRQTFCYLDNGVILHPDTELSNGRSIITPVDVSTNVWFVQSCHSPFIWDDFGSTYRL